MSTRAHPLYPGALGAREPRRSRAEPPHHRWSFRVGRLAGIPVYLHGTFVLLLAWIALSRLLQGHGLYAAMTGVALVAAVFAVVVLHELGHALAARHYGIPTRDITLYPIGGVGRLERLPEKPSQELAVAFAGPAVNLVLAGLALLALAAMKAPVGPRAVNVVGGPLLTNVLWFNLGLAGFNLLPAFPMDGGRVLRALLALRMDRVRATDWAVRIGRVMAVAFGLFALYGQPLLLFIAIFVWMAAEQEAVEVHVRSSLEGATVADATSTDFRALPADARVEDAVEHALAGAQEAFPVIDDGSVVGMVSRRELLRAVTSGEAGAPVTDVMRREFPSADVGEPLVDALQRLTAANLPALPVTRRGELVGLLTTARIGELAMMREHHAHA
ncbi:MAG TPA: site-2 protease family protein [Minicystis sp.]|nr:site-2 protease family protein [Minicystis sp.]